MPEEQDPQHVAHRASDQRRDYKKYTPRDLAYKAIDDERDYQDSKHPGVRTVPQQAALIIRFADKLENVKAGPNFDAECLNIMREIAALAVRTMETYGAPLRVRPAKEEA